MKLYELTAEYQALADTMYNEETGEINEKSLVQLNALKGDIQEKCIALAKVFKNIEAERQAIAIEKENMAKREKAHKKQVEWLKHYLLENMQNAQISKISCPYFDIKLAKNPPRIQIEDETFIEDQYKVITVEYDKARMRLDLLNGKIIPGVKLVNGERVVIK